MDIVSCENWCWLYKQKENTNNYHVQVGEWDDGF